METRLDFSSVYHPQTDGQSVVVNSIVLDLLKPYVNDVDHHNQWEKYLPLVEYAYNNMVHSSTGKALFEIIKGRPKVPPILRMHQNIFALADEYVCYLQTLFEKIKDAIRITQKSAPDKHRRALDFKEDDGKRPKVLC